MWEKIVRLNVEEARRGEDGTQSNWSNAADPGGNDYHQERYEMQKSCCPDDWESFGHTWNLHSDGKGWKRLVCATATSKKCKVEQMKDEWAKEHCKIIATHPRTDTQQADPRVQQDDQNCCTQKVLVNVFQAIKGLQ